MVFTEKRVRELIKDLTVGHRMYLSLLDCFSMIITEIARNDSRYDRIHVRIYPLNCIAQQLTSLDAKRPCSNACASSEFHLSFPFLTTVGGKGSFWGRSCVAQGTSEHPTFTLLFLRYVIF